MQLAEKIPLSAYLKHAYQTNNWEKVGEETAIQCSGYGSTAILLTIDDESDTVTITLEKYMVERETIRDAIGKYETDNDGCDDATIKISPSPQEMNQWRST